MFESKYVKRTFACAAGLIPAAGFISGFGTACALSHIPILSTLAVGMVAASSVVGMTALSMPWALLTLCATKIADPREHPYISFILNTLITIGTLAASTALGAAMLSLPILPMLMGMGIGICIVGGKAAMVGAAVTVMDSFSEDTRLRRA